MPKRKGLHGNSKSDLRSLKKGEKVVYGGGGFHIVKSDTKTKGGKK